MTTRANDTWSRRRSRCSDLSPPTSAHPQTGPITGVRFAQIVGNRPRMQALSWRNSPQISGFSQVCEIYRFVPFVTK